jgi:hypothetical protein
MSAVQLKRSADSCDNGDDSKRAKIKDVVRYDDKNNEDDKLICRFEDDENVAEAIQPSTVQDIFVYNLNKNNRSLVYDKSGLLSQLLAFMSESMNIYEYQHQIVPNVSPNIRIKAPISPQTVFNIGIGGENICGASIPFRFFDVAKVTRCKSKFGEYMTVVPSNLMHLNTLYGNIMKEYLKVNMAKLENRLFVNLPGDDKMNKKTMFVRSMFKIDKENNEAAYSTGDIKHKLIAKSLSVKEFNEMFEMRGDEPSDEHTVVIGGIISGVKYGKESTLETVNNKKVTEKPLTLAINPKVFFIFDQIYE